jgi:hypothetical protein
MPFYLCFLNKFTITTYTYHGTVTRRNLNKELYTVQYSALQCTNQCNNAQFADSGPKPRGDWSFANRWASKKNIMCYLAHICYSQVKGIVPRDLYLF